jgi:glucose/arabinose dehydrogenase
VKARVGGALVAACVAAGAGTTLVGGPPDAIGGPRAPYALEVVVAGFRSPVEVAAAPGEPKRLYVVEQPGWIRVVEGGRVRAEPFADLRDLVKSGGEQGLLGLAFHPRYAENRRLYVNLTDVWGDTRVLEFRSDGRRLLRRTRREILFADQPYLNHNGGKIAFGRDGRLYVALGDGGSAFDPEERAQNPRSLMGKLIRVDVDGRRPRHEVIGYGLRNPWRFSFDRATGDLYIGDVGQNRYEEVNAVRRGERRLLDFGWDVYEGRQRIAGPRRNPRGRLTWPIATYTHDPECSITGGVVYRGEDLPELRGRYLFGDTCSGAIWTLRWDGRRPRVPIRRESVRLPLVVAFGEDARGEILLATHSGELYRLVRAD